MVDILSASSQKRISKMNAGLKSSIKPVVRTQLDFKLDELPRYWFAGDPFLTRMFCALSLPFPGRERYVIQRVRLLCDKITIPELQNRVADFIRQETQQG